MGLKLLVLPTLIGLSLVLVVMFIQPGVMSILEQRGIEATKQEALSKIETVEKNIRSIESSLNTRQDLESLVRRYYPEKMDEERAVDMINFLAQQSGVVVTALNFDQDLKRNSAVSNPAPAPGDGSVDILANTEPATEPPQSYKASINVLGPYEGIRSFFERLYRTDRLLSIDTFTLEEPERTGESPPPENFLAGGATVIFQYAPVKRAGNVLHYSLFQNETLNYASVNQLTDFINSPVSDLVVPTLGRSNPFQVVP